MFYAGDEWCPDEITSFLDHPGWDEDQDELDARNEHELWFGTDEDPIL